MTETMIRLMTMIRIGLNCNEDGHGDVLFDILILRGSLGFLSGKEVRISEGEILEL